MNIADAKQQEKMWLPNPMAGTGEYEWKAVTLLSLGFGLLGLDRWIIVPLFPFIMKDLKLGYHDLGNLVAVLGICWGASSIILGAASDKIGRRKILIPRDYRFFTSFQLLRELPHAGFASLADNSRADGCARRCVLPHERGDDRGRLRGQATWFESGYSAERVRAVWFGVWSFGRHATVALRADVAVGVPRLSRTFPDLSLLPFCGP